MVVTHRFEFDSVHRAANFARRLHRVLVDIATCRTDCTVYVLDAADPPQTVRIHRIARVSSATWKKWVTPR